MTEEYDVLIIGGGATGAGTARDCARRGLRTALVEKGDFAEGATGRNHGLLHSGARYAVTDQESARECIRENMILRRMASHCIDELDGLFVTLEEDDLQYQQQFIEACRSAGIRADAMDPDEALRLEPSLNPGIKGAVRVPDGYIDPFRLTTANVMDAREHGAVFHTYTEVVGLIRESDRIRGAVVRDRSSGEKREIRARVTVNAAGIWGQGIAALAGISLTMFPAKGTLLVFGHRVNNMVINRCRKPSNADILVPGDSISIIGTTSDRIPYDSLDKVVPTASEVDLLIREGSRLVPSLAETRILRAYCGVRPLVADDSDPTGRSISRGIVCLDHGQRDGLDGFVTITGGKLMTYRLMAQKATDVVCSKLGVDVPCTTAEVPLPGSGSKDGQKAGRMSHKAAMARLGTLAGRIPEEGELLCECEHISEGEVDYAVRELGAGTLSELRRRSRIGMGTCQGEYCALRAALRLKAAGKSDDFVKKDIMDFLDERWKGIRPVAWGEALREAQFSSWLYEGVYGLGWDGSEKEDAQ